MLQTWALNNKKAFENTKNDFNESLRSRNAFLL